MVFLNSFVNGCTYTLDPDNNSVLYYAPLQANGNIETSFYAYAEVEWEHLEDDAWYEADRCLALLKADFDTPIAQEVYGG